MSNFCDAEMSDVIVVLDKKFENRIDDAVAELTNVGLQVVDVDRDNGVVEGTIDASRLADLRRLDCVDYLRQTFSWIADYPPGDPRNHDQCQRPTE